MKNKFGMFVHFGIYALTEYHEQAFAKLDMEREEYEGLAKKFNPKDFNAQEWVLLAKSCGMKYICFTTKHHDGFCMWNTKYTDYNIMNTPYGRDFLRELADACEKHGILLSLYYSNPDWHHPYGYNPASSHQMKAIVRADPDTQIYREYIKNQIRELLSDYGKIYTLFWDIPPNIYDPSVNELVRSLQPDILINDRGFDTGDFSTPEREYTRTEEKRYTRMTEACNSLGVQSWGYRKNENFYSVSHLIGAIDRTMAMGGSYLLNVGPNADGVITPEYASRLRKIGDWYNRMEGCLEDNEEDTFDYRVSGGEAIVNKKNGKTYIHFPSSLYSDAAVLYDYPSIPKHVRLMNDKRDLSFCAEPLPEYAFSAQTGEKPPLRITGIPVDEFVGEAIVLELTF